MQAAIAEVKKVIVGQKALIDRMMVALLCRGHLLVEGVPGLAKTLAVKTLGQVLDLHFSRIQFTPDLLPADLIGTMIYQQKTGEFAARKGPVFANLVLADEINRAPAKVQSALLEAMQERQVTIGDKTYPLPEPFLVLATQNPIEQEGTYPLPEAQVDRFMLKLKVDYPRRRRSGRSSTACSAARRRRWPGARPTSRLRPRASDRSTSTRRSATTSSTSSAPRAGRAKWASSTSPPSSPSAPRRAPPWPSPRPRGRWPSCAAAATWCPRTSRRSRRTCCATASSLTYEAEAENVTTDTVVERILERVEVP